MPSAFRLHLQRICSRPFREVFAFAAFAAGLQQNSHAPPFLPAPNRFVFLG
jgi:hypothetical protein